MKKLAETTKDQTVRRYAVLCVLVDACLRAARVKLARFYAAQVAAIRLDDNQIAEVANAQS